MHSMHLCMESYCECRIYYERNKSGFCESRGNGGIGLSISIVSVFQYAKEILLKCIVRRFCKKNETFRRCLRSCVRTNFDNYRIIAFYNENKCGILLSHLLSRITICTFLKALFQFAYPVTFYLK